MDRRSTEDWNLIDRGEEPDRDKEPPGADGDPRPLQKTDSARKAPDSGAGAEPPD